MKRFLKLIPFIFAACILINTSSEVRADHTKVLKFSAIPDQNTTELTEKFNLLANDLTTRLGIKTEYVPSRDYQATVEMFKNGDIDMAWFGGLTGVQARAKVPGSLAIAQGDTDPKYVAYFIANASTGLSLNDKFPADIGKFRFTFGSASSTSGRLMPEYFMRQATGKGPDQLFKTPVGYSGSHDKTLELVASGQYEVGVLNYKVYDKAVKEGKIDPSKVKIIWKTPEFTDYNFSVIPQIETKFGKGFTQKLQAALISIDKPELLAAILRDRLIPAKNDDYKKIEEVAKSLDMLR